MKKLLSILFIFLLLFLISGCFNITKIETIKSWEGHFYTYEEFTNATKNIKLDKQESIWVMSNSTLKRILTNIKEK